MGLALGRGALGAYESGSDEEGVERVSLLGRHGEFCNEVSLILPGSGDGTHRLL
jgi:hypothetical protein